MHALFTVEMQGIQDYPQVTHYNELVHFVADLSINYQGDPDAEDAS